MFKQVKLNDAILKFYHRSQPIAFSNAETLYDDLVLLRDQILMYGDLSEAQTNYLNEFIEQFDKTLSTTVRDIFEKWLSDGFLVDFIRDIINEEVVESRDGESKLNLRLNRDKQELTTQITQNKTIISDINISIRDFPRLGGEDNDSPRIQRCIDYIKNNSKSGTVLLTSDNFEIKETIVLPDHYTIKLKGMGNFENAQGTRLSWVGLNNDSVVEVNDYSQVEDLFIQTTNGATGIIGIDGLGSVGGRSPSRFKINNVHVKRCSIGFGFNYGWYNSLYDCFATFCDVGYQFGYESNNFGLYSCHANSCKKGVELIGTGSNQVAFYSCSFEVNSEVAIDLSVGTSRAWSFNGLYLESNTQSMLLGGQVTFDTVFINGDWVVMENNPTPACIEILSSAGINIGSIYTTLSLPKDKLLFFNIEKPTYSVNRSISLGTTYPTGFYSKSFATDLQNQNGALLKGLINLDNTNIKLIKSPLLDATIPYNNPIIKDAIDYEGYTVFGAYLMVTETLVLDNDYIVRFGNTVASEWSNYINVNLGSDNILPSQTILNVTIDFKLNPTNFTYRLNNTLATSGKYQVVFLATV